MKIKPEELEKKGYILADKLKHNELISFLNKKNKQKKSFYFYLYLIFLILPIPIISFLLTKNIISGKTEIVTGLLYCLLGFGFVFVFIPFHELLHALAYKVIGAKNVSFYSNFKKMYFAAISDKSVLNVNEFKIVALTPFLFVILVFLLLVSQMNIDWLLSALSFITVHNLFCSGDFSLLNYMLINKEKGIVTFDNKERGETYFYVKGSEKDK